MTLFDFVFVFVVISFGALMASVVQVASERIDRSSRCEDLHSWQWNTQPGTDYEYLACSKCGSIAGSDGTV